MAGKLIRKSLILSKIESTYGTDSTPGGTEAIQVKNLSVTPMASDTVSRDLIRPYLGASEQLLAMTRVECSFSVELAGSGTAGTAPKYDALLRACGLDSTIVPATSVEYTPVSDAFESATIYYNIDGILHKLTGCRGTFVINCAVNEIPTIDFSMTGIYNSPTDTAAPSVTYSNQATPLVFKNGNTTNFQLYSYAGCLQSVSFDIANATVYRELVGCTKSVLITDRQSNGSVTMELPTIAQKDYFTAALTDGTTGNLQFTHGTTAGNRVALTCDQVDIGDVSYEESDGIAMITMPYTALPTTAGNDEVSLTFT